MKLSVIIPCYNAADTIAEQLEALASQEWSEPWEIIVADNRSTDESTAIVKQYQERLPNLRIVDASARQGQPYALNVGVQAARGEAVALCDADDVVAPGWVAAMGEALSKYDAVGCRMEIEKLNEPWLQKGRTNPQQTGVQQYRYPPYLPHVGGGTLGFKRSLFETIGEFDESLPLLHDTDFCWRLQLAGKELHFVPDAVIHIRYRNSLSAYYRQARNYGEYNALLYKRYRPFGMSPIPLKYRVRAWRRVFKSLQGIYCKEGRAKFFWRFGYQVGRLRGSIKHRVLGF